MLEEALSSTTYSPAEAALTFLSFLEVELAAGGAAAESRFFKLFSLLCDRVFGELSNGEGFKHQVGGWLGRHAKWESPNNSLPSPNRNRIAPRTPVNSNSLAGDPVIKLLGAASIIRAQASRQQQQPLALIEVFAKEAEYRPNVRYSFPFEAFPKSTQQAWLAIIEETLRGVPAAKNLISENATHLLGSLFRVKPLEQLSLRQNQQEKTQLVGQHWSLQLSPLQFQPRQPISPAATQQPTTPSKDKDSSPRISLSMLEYYLVLFLRYPLAPPQSQTQSGPTKTIRSSVPVSNLRRTEPYGDSVYYQLFQEYADYYVPNNFPRGHSAPFSPLHRPSELFVRIIVELWLEGQSSFLWTTENALRAFLGRSPQCQVDLNTSFELVKTTYSPCPSQINRCLHKLISRAVSDGTVLDQAKDLFMGTRSIAPEITCLSPTMAILQLPVYNHIRTAFRHASVHVVHSPFYAALNDWLVWLEPWNTRHDSGRVHTQGIMDMSRLHDAFPTSRVTYPRGTQHSTYKPYWEPYIAANLHLYTVPLALFLRRSRELDFSPGEFQRSLNTVRRVFRVFSPEVVATINTLMRKESGSKWVSIAAQHEARLGAFAPPAFTSGLSSCQDDMQNLLEEMCVQHIKKVDSMDFFDRAIARIEGIFGGGPLAGEEKELRKLISQAKGIVGFPVDYEIFSRIRPSSDFSFNDQGKGEIPDRVTNGYFSPTGVERIAAGSIKCSPFEIGYVGDRMQSRPQSFEIAFLIPLLVNFSVFLNNSFGIRVSTIEGIDDHHAILPRRFNLRFLADTRNLVLLAISICLTAIIFRK